MPKLTLIKIVSKSSLYSWLILILALNSSWKFWNFVGLWKSADHHASVTLVRHHGFANSLFLANPANISSIPQRIIMHRTVTHRYHTFWCENNSILWSFCGDNRFADPDSSRNKIGVWNNPVPNRHDYHARIGMPFRELLLILSFRSVLPYQPSD